MKYCSLILLLTAYIISLSTIRSQVIPEGLASSVYSESIDAYELALQLNDRTTNISDRTINKTYQLDSIYAFLPQRTIGSEDSKSAVKYKFRELGLTDETYSWYCSGVFCSISPSTVTTLQYNSDDQLLGLTGHVWEGESCIHDFELPHQIQYHYNDRGRLIIKSRPGAQNNYHYNNQDLLEKFTVSFWDSEIDTFMVSGEFYYTYNDQNLVETILETSYRSNFGGFIPTDSSYFQYYDSGQLRTKETFFIIQVDPEVAWQASEFRKYTYNADNTINTEEYYDLILVDPDTLWQ